MVRLELLRLATPRGLDQRVGVAAGLLPRVGDGDDFKVGRGEVRNDALFEVGTFAAGADADLSDADAVVGTDGAGAFGGGEEARGERGAGGEGGGGFQEITAGEGGGGHKEGEREG